MAAKTYAECELSVSRELDRISDMENVPNSQQLLFKLELAISIAAREMYAAELLRDQSNTAEMHQLLERLGGGK